MILLSFVPMLYYFYGFLLVADFRFCFSGIHF